MTPNSYRSPYNDTDLENQRETPNQGQWYTTCSASKTIPPPPLFFKGVLDYIGLHNTTIALKTKFVQIASHVNPPQLTSKSKQTIRTIMRN